MPHEAMLELRGVSVRCGAGSRAVDALADVSFTVAAREFVCLLGPSGCGKSTLLHLAAGLIHPGRGAVLADGRVVTGPAVDRGMAFQQHNLFPWLTVLGNVEFGPRLRGIARDRRAGIARAYLEEVGLKDFAGHYPRQLSIGMQQRVGLARAFANDPAILLMDEPFGSLDALTRLQMQALLMSVWEKHRKTVLFVTHDVEEAVLLADRILILSPRPGRIVREFAVGLPRPRVSQTDERAAALKASILMELGRGQDGREPPP